MQTVATPFTDQDLRQLEAHGVSLEQAKQQLQYLRDGFAPLAVLRPCHLGYGIIKIDSDEEAELLALYEEAAAAGRLMKFVPASGAATRMVPEGGDAIPKALIPFHKYPDETRTALHEHLVEATHTVRDRNGLCRLHFTVRPDHREQIQQHIDLLLQQWKDDSSRFEIQLSEQDPATDTIALTPTGELFHNDDGRLHLRPGGHGALLKNLERAGGDIILIKNIDNVLPETRAQQMFHYKKLLVGTLLKQQATESDRPVRVCGVVPNQGEPGGGPYWVRDSDGRESLQIVEASQLSDHHLTETATHFNPVDLVCGVRDKQGRPFLLTDFADPEAGLIVAKKYQGHDIRALEWPGLWNGGMAKWHTVFAEVPAATFAPVKAPADLQRPEHSV